MIKYLSNPVRSEIDVHTGKLIVGLIALFLANVTSSLSGDTVINSLSQSYHIGGWARDILVGSLCAIFAFLLSFNGRAFIQKILSKIAAFAAIGVA